MKFRCSSIKIYSKEQMYGFNGQGGIDYVGVSLDSLAEKMFDNFKKITPALVASAILTGLLLFLPKSILVRMNLDVLPEFWNRIIGIVFLLSVTLIMTMIVFSVINMITEERRNKRIRRNLKKKYKTLSPRQRSIILDLLHSEDKTIALDKNSGDTIYLVNNLFLYMPQQVITLGRNNEMIVTYVPQRWLSELYNEEPELFN